MERDFERIGGQYTYDPKKDNVERDEESYDYLGTLLGKPVLDEISVWASLLNALKDGLPKPFDNSVMIDKINKLERKTHQDLSYLKKCCPPSSDVREAKDFKPIIFGILDRIKEISGLKKYTDRYERY